MSEESCKCCWQVRKRWIQKGFLKIQVLAAFAEMELGGYRNSRVSGALFLCVEGKVLTPQKIEVLTAMAGGDKGVDPKKINYWRDWRKKFKTSGQKGGLF